MGFFFQPTPLACFLIRALPRSSPCLCFSWEEKTTNQQNNKPEIIASLVKLALAERAPGERCCPGGAGASGSPCCPPASVPSAGGQPLTPINSCHLVGPPRAWGYWRFGWGSHRYLPGAAFPRVGFAPGTIVIVGPVSRFGHLHHSGLCVVLVPSGPTGLRGGLGQPEVSGGLVFHVCAANAQVCLCLEE